MTIYEALMTLTEYNRTGLVGLFTYSAETVPIFIPLLLVAIFTITFLASFFSQKRLFGNENFFGSISVAGWITFIITMVLSLIEGLIDKTTIGIVFVVAIGSLILLLTQTKD